jgi:cyclopropane-fatty-acyl-phospholipid synthase
MKTDIYKELSDEGVFRFGSEDLEIFEKRLTIFFTREYKLHKGNENTPVILNNGPLALAPEDLADYHYDEGIPFFKTFLDEETMSYTMAFFSDDADEALKSNKTLDQAQLDKFKLIAKRMKIQGDEKLLNLGCGFGYFESFLLNTYPEIQISSITHSKDQHEFLISRMNDPGDELSSDRFRLFFGELDNNTSSLLGKNRYDVVCSVGLVEQIKNLEIFFEIINDLLVDNGRTFHHLIVSRDRIPQFLDPEETLIGEYFPGGIILPFTAIKNYKFEHFEIEDAWFVNGINYWQTLNKWHTNFWDNMNLIYPGQMDSKRVDHWNKYFVLCKAIFLPEKGQACGNGQYLFYKKT